jgi:predicted acylesterase/phospholipase RssA
MDIRVMSKDFTNQANRRHGRLPDRVTLVLGAGGARGLAHVGVLQALEARGITVERLVGSSMGALVAAVYALDGSTAPAEARLQEALATAPRQFSFHRRRLELYETRPYRRLLARWFGARRFEDLLSPTTVNVVDLHSGQELRIRRGPVAPALWAASAIPGLYAPVRHGDRLLVDGGLVNPLPLDLAAEAGAGFVIAVDVLPEADTRVDLAHHFGEQGTLLRKLGLLTGVVSKSFDIVAARRRDDLLRAYPPGLLITPDLRGFSSTAYAQGRAIVERGRAAAERVLRNEE